MAAQILSVLWIQPCRKSGSGSGYLRSAPQTENSQIDNSTSEKKYFFFSRRIKEFTLLMDPSANFAPHSTGRVSDPTFEKEKNGSGYDRQEKLGC